MTIRIPSNALVVLAGPSGSGKSAWAARWFDPGQVVSSDALRAMVGTGQSDQRASADAFSVLDLIVERRLKRGLLTVIDTLGMDADTNTRWIEMARASGRPTHLVCLDTPDKTCRSRNRSRAKAVPSKVLTGQLKTWADVRPLLSDNFDELHAVGGEAIGVDEDVPVAVVPPLFAQAAAAADAQQADPIAMRFGLMVGEFAWGDKEDLATRLGEVAVEAERAGFSSLWVMDHFIQIPQVGREWDPMLEAWSTLGFLAARTQSLRLGTLVTGITYRNIALVAKLAATLDVLSGGRAICGLGAAWFEREHAAYGYEFPPLAERYELLEDALELLPLMWGSGAPAYEGRHFSTAEALCYPRPIQDPIPILVGGSGEKKTLRLVARHADACNLFGDPAEVRHKVGVLHGHCATEGRDPADIAVTHLSNALCSPTRAELSARLDELSHGGITTDDLAVRTSAGTPEDHIGRYRELAEVGVQEAIVSLADVGMAESIANFGPVIDAFAR